MRIRDYLIKQGIDPAIAFYAEHSLKRHAKRILSGEKPSMKLPACNELGKPLGPDVFKPRYEVKP